MANHAARLAQATHVAKMCHFFNSSLPDFPTSNCSFSEYLREKSKSKLTKASNVRNFKMLSGPLLNPTAVQLSSFHPGFRTQAWNNPYDCHRPPEKCFSSGKNFVFNY